MAARAALITYDLSGIVTSVPGLPYTYPFPVDTHVAIVVTLDGSAKPTSFPSPGVVDYLVESPPFKPVVRSATVNGLDENALLQDVTITRAGSVTKVAIFAGYPNCCAFDLDFMTTDPAIFAGSGIPASINQAFATSGSFNFGPIFGLTTGVLGAGSAVDAPGAGPIIGGLMSLIAIQAWPGRGRRAKPGPN